MTAPVAASASSRALMGTAVAATIAGVYPGFLVGAVAVQVRDEFEVSAARYGWAMGAYFLAATGFSILGGRLVQRIGPRRQITVCLSATFVAQLAIVTLVDSFGAMVGLLAGCGVVNAANQTAINLALTRARLPRLGLAIALKQSGMPSASMLSGATVPILVLRFGWRSAFVLGAAIAVVGLIAVLRFVEPGAVAALRSARPVSSRRALYWSLVSGSFLAFGAGGLTSWLVSSGVDAGLSEATAGWMLSAGAAFGVSIRLAAGSRLDTLRVRPYTVAAGLAAVGAIGMAGLAPRVTALHVAATFLAFGAGWVWPVFTNFGIMRTNGDASGAASGVTQMGIYLGVFAGPLVTGWVIDRSGYTTMWLVVAAALLIGATLTYAIRDEF